MPISRRTLAKSLILSLILMAVPGRGPSAPGPGRSALAEIPGRLARRRDDPVLLHGRHLQGPGRGRPGFPLTISEAYDYAPVWSHDGRSVAFASDRYGNFDVFVMPAEGGEARRLTYPLRPRCPQRLHARTTQAILFTRGPPGLGRQRPGRHGPRSRSSTASPQAAERPPSS
ncbi:MAG: hypothetical protein MZU84_08620 [Sphingobacterium sp.]|nr:hypothetical protein [Sphingobacterium sp.]